MFELRGNGEIAGSIYQGIPFPVEKQEVTVTQSAWSLNGRV